MKDLNFKRTIIAFITVILILLVILGARILNSNSGSNINAKRFSAAEIKEKMLQGLTYNNYTISYKIDDSIRMKKIKDNIIVVMEPSTGIYGWNDSDSKIAIAGNTITQKYYQIPVVHESLFHKHYLFIEESLEDYGDNLYYVKNEMYNDINCIVIEAGENRDETYWVDEEKGFVLKYEASDGTKWEFTVELNNVTDEDVKKPSLSM